MNLYPLKLRPSPSERLWGGTKLTRFISSFSNLIPQDPIGEAWLVYADNKVINGDYAGKSLQTVADSWAEKLVGTKSMARYGKQIPLLAKFIDAAKPLSIQVHPDDSYARTHEADSGHLGKTEAWYILEAAPDASIIWGLAEEVDKETLRKAILGSTLEPYLNVVPVKAGDVIYNEAGKVHAIGAGIFLFEIQQSSDLTYRLYDYGRKDASGKVRELHIDKALEVADLSVGSEAKQTPKPISDDVTELVRSDYFVMERWKVDQPILLKTNLDSLELLTVLEGKLNLSAGEHQLELLQGDAAVLPAALGSYTFAGEATLIRCYVP